MTFWGLESGFASGCGIRTKAIYGQVKFIENYGREPLVVLEYYQFLGDDAELLFDNTDNPKRTVLLNLSQFERVEIVEE